MTITEEHVGITEFLHKHEPFDAILKQYMDDFLVNEITEDGVVVEQNTMAVPQKTERNTENFNMEKYVNHSLSKSEPRGSGATTVNGGNAVDELVPKEVTALEKKLDTSPPSGTSEMEGNAETPDPSKAEIANTNVSQEKGNEAFDFTVLESVFPDDWKNQVNPLKEALETGSDYTFPPTSDKGARKIVHEWVRNNLPNHFSATVQASDENPVQCVLIRKGKSKDRRGRNSGTQRSKKDPTYVGRFDYVQCTLWKRGRDTMEALNDIASYLRIRTDLLSTAGTKDRRAVTVQRLRVKGKPMHVLARANKARTSFKNQLRCVALGDFEVLRGPNAKPLRLGDLRGNRFTLVLRGVTSVPRNVIEDAITNVKTFGFVNYYGMQRFGSGASPTHHTGFSLLRGDFKDACMRILTPLTIDSVGTMGTVSSRRRSFETALRDFTNGEIDAIALIGKLPGWMHNEKALVKSFVGDEKQGKEHNYKKAFGRLPQNMRTMYVHAVQSYLWNSMASKRVNMFKIGESGRENAIEGDIVLKRPETKSLTCSTLVRKVTKEEEEAHSIGIDEVIIPLVGRKVPVPDGQVGQVVKDIMAEQNLDVEKVFETYGHDLKGAYRRLICVPEKFEHRFLSYQRGTDEPLVPYGVDRNKGNKRKREVVGKAGEKRVKLDNNAGDEELVNGDSVVEGRLEKRKLDDVRNEKMVDDMEKVSDIGNIEKLDSVAMENTKEDVKTRSQSEKDPMVDAENTDTKVMNDGVQMEEKGDTEAVQNLEISSNEIGCDRTEGERNMEADKKERVDGIKNGSTSNEMETALIISFSLLQSSYATMLMRELTQRQTNTAHYRKLSAQQQTEKEQTKEVETLSELAADDEKKQ